MNGAPNAGSVASSSSASRATMTGCWREPTAAGRSVRGGLTTSGKPISCAAAVASSSLVHATLRGAARSVPADSRCSATLSRLRSTTSCGGSPITAKRSSRSRSRDIATSEASLPGSTHA